MNLNKKSKFRAIGLSSFFALSALLGAAVFCPGLGDEVNAATDNNATFQLDFILDRNNIQSQIISSDIANTEKTSAVTFLIDFYLSPKLSISVDDLATPTTASVTPTASGQFTSVQKSFTAKSNSLNGVGVKIYGSSTNLTNGSETITPIASASGLTSANMLTNTWGYNLTQATSAPNVNSITYLPIGTSAASAVSPVPSADSSTVSQTYYLTLGAKVSLAKSAGTYTNTIYVQAIPSATDVAAANAISQSIDEDAIATYSSDTDVPDEDDLTDVDLEEQTYVKPEETVVTE